MDRSALEEAAAGKGKKVLTPEEEAARKRALVKVRTESAVRGRGADADSLSQSYEFLEDQDEKERLAKAEADKPPTVVFQDPKMQSKKARKKAEAGVGASYSFSCQLAANGVHRYPYATQHQRGGGEGCGASTAARGRSSCREEAGARQERHEEAEVRAVPAPQECELIRSFEQG